MIRRIIHIDGEKCNGCGLCADACHEGAIAMVDGKARLIRDDYCDGLGDCLPNCPTGAITFIHREAAAYDEAAVLENQRKKAETASSVKPFACPGSLSRNLRPSDENVSVSINRISQLRQWPVQIKLTPIHAPYFNDAHLLIAADCSAYAYGNFHEEFMKNKVTLIGCPKLDEGDYTEKLTEIIRENNIKSLTITRMEVPCCGGLERAATEALKASGKFIPWNVITISADGKIL